MTHPSTNARTSSANCLVRALSRSAWRDMPQLLHAPFHWWPIEESTGCWNQIANPPILNQSPINNLQSSIQTSSVPPLTPDNRDADLVVPDARGVQMTRVVAAPERDRGRDAESGGRLEHFHARPSA